jgi:mannose-6-phosphate isomerase-like protein (cupin superfamily)
MILPLLLLAAAPAPAEPPAVVQRDGAEHYVWGGVNDGWHLVKRDDLSIIEERLQPASREVRHYHVRARQFFYVLRGDLTMEAGGAVHRLTAGQGIEIAPGVPHQARNDSAQPVEIIVTSTPKSHGDRVEAPAALRGQE